MGYSGDTFVIDCSQGGLNGNPNGDAIAPSMMVAPTRNVNLHNGVREKRGGTAHVYASAFSATPAVRGLFDFILRDETQFLIAFTADGKIYKDDTNTIKTGLSTSEYPAFEQGENKLFVTDHANTPQIWDGAAASTSDIAHAAADWATYPVIQFVRHGRGASQRMWGINKLGVYYSVGTDMEDFTGTGSGTIQIDTGDGFGLVGGIRYGERLFLFGKQTSYIIDDESTTLSEWGYVQAQFKGGAAHFRLIVQLPNDVVCMMEDGEIYSVSAVQSYGDYKLASLTRPSWMHKWIQENVDLAQIAKFFALYDPYIRAIRFFVVSSGNTAIDTCLVYFVDRKPDEAWMVHASTADSGFKASSAALIRKSAGSYKVYTGGNAGFVWELEKEDKNDNGVGFYGGFKTPYIAIENPRQTKRFKAFRVVMMPQGSYNLSVNFWIDGVPEGTGTISMAGSGGVLGSFVLDTDVLEGSNLLDSPGDIGAKGKRIQFEFYNSSADQDFSVAEILVDYKILGARP